MRGAKVIVIISFALVAGLLLAAIINYWYPHSETIPKSYTVVNTIDVVDIKTNQTSKIDRTWKLAVNFTTNDVLAVGSKINVTIIARPQEDYSYHVGARAIFPHAVSWDTEYLDGHALAGAIPLIQDANDPQKFTGSHFVKFIESGPDCLMIKEPTLIEK